MKKFLGILVAMMLCVLPVFASGASEKKDANVVEINFPTFLVGVNSSASWFKERAETLKTLKEGK